MRMRRTFRRLKFTLYVNTDGVQDWIKNYTDLGHFNNMYLKLLYLKLFVKIFVKIWKPYVIKNNFNANLKG